MGKKLFFRLILIGLTILFISIQSNSCWAQIVNPYDYQSLSHLVNIRLRDSLKKNWTAPALYRDNKTQKKFKELWDDRTNYLVTAINNKNFIQEREIYDYVSGIIQQLQNGNAGLIPQKPILLIDRNGSVNAYSMGSHIICVNLGLISYSRNREEIALALAHELAHDILGHAEESLKERAEWLTSDEYKKSLNEVLDSKYERYSRLKKLMDGYTYSSTRHTRYHESEADSLAVVLLRNSNVSFDARNFLRLDSSDRQYLLPLSKPLKEYFVSLELPFEESWTRKTMKGLSSKNYDFNRSATLADSLKTHPDCVERYERTRGLSSTTVSSTPIPSSLLNKVSKMIIWDIFDNQNLTACLYRIFQEQDKGRYDAWYEFMLFNVFSGLSYSDNQLERFNAIKITYKENVSRQYYELQTMLEQLPRDILHQYHNLLAGKNFWVKLPADARTMKEFFQTILKMDNTDKIKETAAKTFITTHTNSMYCEFTDHFITK